MIKRLLNYISILILVSCDRLCLNTDILSFIINELVSETAISRLYRLYCSSESRNQCILQFISKLLNAKDIWLNSINIFTSDFIGYGAIIISLLHCRSRLFFLLKLILVSQMITRWGFIPRELIKWLESTSWRAGPLDAERIVFRRCVGVSIA